jgi:hypothetical protein
MHLLKRAAAACVAAATGIATSASVADANTVNFGCSSGNRVAAATAYYTAPSATQCGTPGPAGYF